MAKQAEETDPQAAAAAFPGLSIEAMLHDYDGREGRDILAKVHEFKLAEQARALDVYPFFQPLDRNDGPEAQIYGRRVLMLGSNNYLGLTRHPRVIKAAQDAVAEHGTSLTGSRLLNGTTHLHEKLEERIAEIIVPPGGTRRVNWTAPSEAAAFPVYCDLAGHRAAGMELTLKVVPEEEGP